MKQRCLRSLLTSAAVSMALAVVVKPCRAVEWETNAVVQTLAGAGIQGHIDGIGVRTAFASPTSIVIGSSGTIYVHDFSNFAIRTINSESVVETLPNLPNEQPVLGTYGPLTFLAPDELVTVRGGGAILRLISMSTFDVRHVGTYPGGAADGPADVATFNTITDVAANSSGEIFIADAGNHKVRMYADGIVSTLAGSGNFGMTDGRGIFSSFRSITAIAVDELTGDVMVADGDRLRRITREGVVKTLIQAGPNIRGMAFGPNGDLVFAHDDGVSPSIRRFSDGVVTIVAGGNGKGFKDGDGREAQFLYPQDVAVTSGGEILVADTVNHRVRKIVFDAIPEAVPAADFNLQAYPGVEIEGRPGRTYRIEHKTQLNDEWQAAEVVQLPHSPYVWFDKSGVASPVRFYRALLLPVQATPIAGGAQAVVETLAGSGFVGHIDGVGTETMFDRPSSLAVSLAGTVYVLDAGNALIRAISTNRVVTTLPIPSEGFGDLAFLPPDELVTLRDGQAIRIHSLSTGEVREIQTAFFIAGLAASSAGELFFITKQYQVGVYSNGAVSILAGLPWSGGRIDGRGVWASFSGLRAIAVNDLTGEIMVVDDGWLRRVTREGVVETVVQLDWNIGNILGMAFGPKGDLYLADSIRMAIWRYSAGVFTLVAGRVNLAGFTDGDAQVARFDQPKDLAVTPQGEILVADYSNHRIRRILFNPDPEEPPPAELALQVYPGIEITGILGRLYRIEFRTHANAEWETAEEVRLAESPCLWLDTTAPKGDTRSYRVLLMP